MLFWSWQQYKCNNMIFVISINCYFFDVVKFKNKTKTSISKQQCVFDAKNTKQRKKFKKKLTHWSKIQFEMMMFMLYKMRSINQALYEIIDVIHFVINYYCCYVNVCSSLMQIDLRFLISIEDDKRLDFISKNEIFLSSNFAT